MSELGEAVRVAEGLPWPGSGESFVLALDRQRWVQLEARPRLPVEEWLGPAPPPEPVPLQLALSQRCLHGSPGVPGLGYACGWC